MPTGASAGNPLCTQVRVRLALNVDVLTRNFSSLPTASRIHRRSKYKFFDFESFSRDSHLPICVLDDGVL